MSHEGQRYLPLKAKVGVSEMVVSVHHIYRVLRVGVKLNVVSVYRLCLIRKVLHILKEEVPRRHRLPVFEEKQKILKLDLSQYARVVDRYLRLDCVLLRPRPVLAVYGYRVAALVDLFAALYVPLGVALGKYPYRQGIYVGIGALGYDRSSVYASRPQKGVIPFAVVWVSCFVICEKARAQLRLPVVYLSRVAALVGKLGHFIFLRTRVAGTELA